MIDHRALFGAFLQRSLGPRRGGILLAAAAASGVAAALVAHDYLSIPPDQASRGLFPPLLREYPTTARYAVGLLFAFRLTADAWADGRAGWMHPLIAAGATRDRYLGLLAGAAAAAAIGCYFVTVSSWLVVLALLGHGMGAIPRFLPDMLVAALWLASCMSFGAAALTVTAHAGAAQGLMVTLLVAPWVTLLSLGVERAQTPPAWSTLLFLAAPPPFIALSAASVGRILVFTGVAGTVAYLLSHRVLRVR